MSERTRHCLSAAPRPGPQSAQKAQHSPAAGSIAERVRMLGRWSRVGAPSTSQEQVDELASAVDDLNPGGDSNNEVLDRLDRVLLLGCRNPILEEVRGGLYSRIHTLRRISAGLKDHD